mmetsp:Transcript_6268/g.23585  ORF Transcript_6268/g.23585 Transcript_6268/m.23585 type:complete len:217 (-) Transcript_6268:122-772(-)
MPRRAASLGPRRPSTPEPRPGPSSRPRRPFRRAAAAPPPRRPPLRGGRPRRGRRPRPPGCPVPPMSDTHLPPVCPPTRRESRTQTAALQKPAGRRGNPAPAQLLGMSMQAPSQRVEKATTTSSPHGGRVPATNDPPSRRQRRHSQHVRLPELSPTPLPSAFPPDVQALRRLTLRWRAPVSPNQWVLCCWARTSRRKRSRSWAARPWPATSRVTMRC